LILSSILHDSRKLDATQAVGAQVLEKMETFIYLLCRLDAVNTEEHVLTRNMILKHQAESRGVRLEDNDEITAYIEMNEVSRFQETRARKYVQNWILQGLRYPSMTYRYESIVEAYPETFDWVFRESTEEQRSWSNFSNWLESGSGVYWINGKAGSGKSTLMKHIFDDSRTRRHLEAWAQKSTEGCDSAPLCLATFFFWNSGDPSQKSQPGLLRALLVQVLKLCPDLIPIIAPHYWERGYSAIITGKGFGGSDPTWNLRQLIDAFKALISQTSIPLKLCFLVDGFDEFEGDHEEMAALFKEVTKSTTVKICLSSRPWVVFQETYCSCPSMRLQDLTFHDIKIYVDGKFDSNPAFRRLAAEEPELAEVLRNEVVARADGVFLWVQIVVKSLLDGMRNHDDIDILRERLERMPRELEPLYKHLVSLIEPVYAVWASKAFQIARAIREHFLAQTGAYSGTLDKAANYMGSRFTICFFFLAISDKHFLVDFSSEESAYDQISKIAHALTKEAIAAKSKHTPVILTARCAGLLEVFHFEDFGINAPIQWLHRTARDFLEQHDVWSGILQHTANTTFDPNLQMLKAYVLWIAANNKTIFDSMKRSPISAAVSNAMLFAYLTKSHIETNNILKTALLDSLDQIMVEWASNHIAKTSDRETVRCRSWTALLTKDLELPPSTGFLYLASLFSQSSYVYTKLVRLPQPDQVFVASKILHELLPSRQDNLPELRLLPLRPRIVYVLLKSGADPNYQQGTQPDDATTWRNTLCWVTTSRDNPRVNSSYVQIMKLLVKAGAREDAAKLKQGEIIGGELAVQQYLLPAYKKEASELLAEMKLQGMMRKAKGDNCMPSKQGNQIATIQPPEEAHLLPPDPVYDTNDEGDGQILKDGNETESTPTSWGYNLIKGIFS
jgi:hypothetical protein